MTQEPRSDTTVQQDMPIKALPEATQTLFNPERRGLPAGVSFVPYDTSLFIFNLLVYGLLVGGCFGGSGIFGLVVMTGSIVSGEYKVTEPADLLVFAGVYVVLIALIIIAWFNFWKPLWYDFLAWSEKNAGQLKRGIFLTPDAMIVRMKTHTCDVLPRRLIEKVELRRGYKSRALYVFHRQPDGTLKAFNVGDRFSFGGLDLHAARSKIETWLLNR